MNPPPPSRRKKAERVLPPCSEAERQHVDAFLAAFDTYSRTIVERLRMVAKKSRPKSVQNQLDQASQWIKLVKWMRSYNRTRARKPETLATLNALSKQKGGAI